MKRPMIEIRVATGDDEIAACYPVMRELRGHLSGEEFLARVRVQQREGYRLAFLNDGGPAQAVAGFRVLHNLLSGRMMYVDDLVTLETARSRGYGKRLLDWLVATARAEGCTTLELDSGVQRFDAHRFYLTQRMFISAHHFTRRL